jgi:hypothetical protein
MIPFGDSKSRELRPILRQRTAQQSRAIKDTASLGNIRQNFG